MAKTKAKRLLSLLLSLAMVMSLVVTPAYAFTDSAAAGESVVTDDGSETNEIYATSGNVASVSAEGKTTVNYTTLADALSNAVSGDTVTLLSDVTLTETLNIYKSITLDLGEYTITSTASGKAIYTTQTLTITATTGGITSSTGYAVLNQKGSGAGSLTINGGTYTSSADHAIYNLAGTVTIESGTISTTYSEKAGVYNTSGGTVTVNGGSISGVKYGIYSSGTVNITAGTITGTAESSSYGVYLASGATATISGGTIKGYEGLRQASSSTASTVSEEEETTATTADVVISGGTFEGVTHAVNVSTTATISGGTFTATGTKEQYAVALYSTGAAVTVSGGTFSGMYSTAWVYSGSGGTIEVAGGCFVNEGTLTDSNSSDKALVRTVAVAVASIGSTNYASLEEAFTAATSGDTITLLVGTSMSSYVTVSDGKSITLDLGKNTLTAKLNVKNGSLTVKNGTVTGTQPLNVYGSATDTANYSVLNIESDVTISEAYWGICLFPNTSSDKLGYGAVINMAGTITSENGVGIFISGNLGNSAETANAMAASSNVSVVNVTGTINTSGPGIAMNGYAVVNVSKPASITGQQAISVKRGVLNVTGGTLTATGDYVDPATANYNGTEETGAAISVTSTYNYAGTIVVNISGGTITSKNGNALYIGHSGTSDTTTAYTTGIEVSVTGGDFSTSGTDVAAVYVAEAEDGDADSYTQAIISGGTYSTAVAAEYCADGYTPTETTVTGEDGSTTTTYTVAKLYLGISTDSEETTSVPAESIDGYGKSVMYVGVSAANITANYTTEKYPTTGLTYTPDSSTDSGTYIFAGWYTLDGETYTACTSDMWDSISEDAVYYAKFIEANVLRVICVYTPYSDGDYDAWRFFSSIDTDNYQEVYFMVDDTSYELGRYYTSYTVQSVDSKKFVPTDISTSSAYLITYSLHDTQKKSSHTVQAGYTTLDGTTVYGTSTTFDATGITTATVLGLDS